MHILMLSHGYPPTVSGVTLVTQKLARAMIRKGHQVTVVTASDRGAAYRDEDEGVQLIRVNSRANHFWSEGPVPIIKRNDLGEILDEIRPDLIHSHDGAILSVQLVRLADEIKVPMICTCQYLPRFITQYIHMGRKVDQIAEALMWEYAIRLMNKFDYGVFSTQTQYKAYLEHGLTTPVTIISNGVDTAHYHPSNRHQNDVEVRYHLPEGPRILFVGRLAKDKDIDVLIRAMTMLKKQWAAHLLLVGRGDDQERLQSMADELDLSDDVHFIGFVPEEDLPALYRSVDIFAIASTCEVQSIPTLQAAATGLPIVAVNAAALPELVEHGGNGYLVPPEDPAAFGRAIEKLISKPEKADIFAQRCLEIGQAHAETRTFEAYEELYKRLLSEDQQTGDGRQQTAMTKLSITGDRGSKIENTYMP